MNPRRIVLAALAAAGLTATAGIVAAAGSTGPATPVTTAPVAATVRLENINRERAAIAAWANREGLVGQSPASLHPIP
jgi:hypothetical protein